MPVKIFFCYAHEDEELRKELEKHLRPLQRQGLIDLWYDRDISAGTNWQDEINRHLNEAQIILLLVSPDFMNSDYCYSIEMKRALERHQRNEAHVIPVILRPAFWQETPIGKLQVLPKNGRPIIARSGLYKKDKAFLEVALGIHEVIKVYKDKVEEISDKVRETTAKNLLSSFTISTIALVHTSRANTLFEHKRYLEAIQIYSQAINLDPDYAFAYFGRAEAFYALRHFDEALADYEQGLSRDPNNAEAYYSKGNMLYRLGRFDEALIAYKDEGNVLYRLGRFDEALAVFQRILTLDSDNTEAYNSKGNVLYLLGRFDEALAAYERALSLDPKNIEAYKKSVLLRSLDREDKA